MLCSSIDCSLILHWFILNSGYIAPEYAMEGLYSVKSDVFSFGVLLLEIITGRRNAGSNWSNQGPGLLTCVSHYLGKFLSVTAPTGM